MSERADAGLVVVAGDDPELLAPLRDALRAADLLVTCCRNVRTAAEALAFHRPGLLVVDVAMEDGAGWDLLRAASARPGTSSLVIDRLGDALVRRTALASGADDVVGPPLVPEEIALRARALLRRQRHDARGPVYRHRDLVIDVAAHEVRAAGRAVRLTPQQFAILRALCEAGGATLHRSQLIARIAAIDDEPPSDRAVDLHVSRLRRRLGDGARRSRYVEAVYGIGYRLAPLDRTDADGAHHASAVLDALPDPVLVLDERLRIRSANRAATRLLERTRDEIVGRGCDELLECRTCEGRSLGGPSCLGRAVLAGDDAVRHARAIVRTDGSEVPVVFSHVPIHDDDGRRMVAIELHLEDPAASA